jgi:hypothetical protein
MFVDRADGGVHALRSLIRGAALAGVAERAEVDLAVSGLKPDWPPRTATAGIALPGAVDRIVPLQQESG